MTRIVRNPKSMNASNPEEVKRVLIDMWALVSEAPLTITADYTTTGRVALERLVCANSTAITIKLDDGPSDGDEVIVNRNGVGTITVDGNGNTINGESTLTVTSRYDSYRLSYNAIAGEWVIVSSYIGNAAAFLDAKSGRKNLLHNPNFDIWQRGTSTSSSGEYLADRWVVAFTAGGSQSQQAFTPGQTDVPGEPEFYIRVISTGSAGITNLVQKIEDVRAGAGQTISISFWGKAASAFTLNANKIIQNFGSGGSGDVTTTIDNVDLTTSWQQFEIQVAIPSISGKTLGAGNSLRLVLRRDSLAFTFDIARVQLEIGNEATDFECRPIAEELALCKRYFERLTSTAVFNNFASLQCFTTTTGKGVLHYTEKREAPTITSNGNFAANNAAGTGQALDALAFTQLGVKTASVDITVASGTPFVAGNASILKANSDASAYIDINAEL